MCQVVSYLVHRVHVILDCFNQYVINSDVGLIPPFHWLTAYSFRLSGNSFTETNAFYCELAVLVMCYKLFLGFI